MSPPSRGASPGDERKQQRLLSTLHVTSPYCGHLITITESATYRLWQNKPLANTCNTCIAQHASHTLRCSVTPASS